VVRAEIRRCWWYDRPKVAFHVGPPPCDLAAERYVLSSMWEGALAPPWLTAEHFAPLFHSHVFDVLRLRSKPLEVATVEEIEKALRARGWPPGVDLTEDLRAIELWPCAAIEAPALVVREMAVRRDVLLRLARFDAMLRINEYEDLGGAAHALRSAADLLDRAAADASKVRSLVRSRSVFRISADAADLLREAAIERARPKPTTDAEQ
jgi:hypothetical protein